MTEELKKVLAECQQKMQHAFDHASEHVGKVRAGKAMPNMLDTVVVEYYGALTPLSQVGNISTPDARTLMIQPWEKGLIPEIEKGIAKANLGLNPQNDGNVVRITVPPLTEERRKQLVKQAKQEAEDGKIAIRNIRKDYNERIKALVKSGLPQDEGKEGEVQTQKYTDNFIVLIDKELEAKEKEIMTV